MRYPIPGKQLWDLIMAVANEANMARDRNTEKTLCSPKIVILDQLRIPVNGVLNARNNSKHVQSNTYVISLTVTVRLKGKILKSLQVQLYNKFTV